jgi:hypothetical protein
MTLQGQKCLFWQERINEETGEACLAKKTVEQTERPEIC